jgi:hypothetical protein
MALVQFDGITFQNVGAAFPTAMTAWPVSFARRIPPLPGASGRYLYGGRAHIGFLSMVIS